MDRSDLIESIYTPQAALYICDINIIDNIFIRIYIYIAIAG